MHLKKYIYIVIGLFMCVLAKAQDPQFTQFYANTMYLNPAFTGLTYEHRFSIALRDQWPGIKRTYRTGMFSYDYNLSDLNSGIGMFVLQDEAGTSRLKHTQGGLSYAYRFKTGKNAEVRSGLQIVMNQKRLDYTKLIFNDQFVNGANISQDALSIEKVNYVDIGAGAVYNNTNYWLGIAAKHLNQPNASLIGNIEPLPVYVNVHGGYRYIITARGSGKTKLEEFISASVHYRHEQRYDQLDIGAYYFKDFIQFGLWYRGLPYKRYKPGFGSRESISALVGLEIPDQFFKIGYSYDLTVSRLGVNNSQGAHEITLVYEVAKKKKRNKRVVVSCPKF